MPIHEPTMSEGGARFWSVIFGGVTALGLVFGGVYTAIQYVDARRNEAIARQKEAENYALQAASATLEAKKPYYAKHLDLCSEASTAAATLATTKDARKKKAASEDFWRLYMGPLAIVEEEKVAGDMVSFGRCLQGTCPKPIEQLSLNLARSCRDEISKHFSLDLTMVSKPTLSNEDAD